MAVEAKAPLWCYTESFPSNGGNINLLGHTQWQLPNKSLPQLDGISFLLHTVMLSSMAQPWRLSSIHFCVNLRDLEAPTYLSSVSFSPAQITLTLISLLATHPLASFISFFTFRSNFFLKSCSHTPVLFLLLFFLCLHFSYNPLL